MKNFPMDLLRSFALTAEHKSVTKTGERLGRSQPTISLQLKRLEDMVGAPLFYRQNRQLTLTGKGEQLFDYAAQILHLNDEAFRQLISPSLSGSIRFGIPSEFATNLLPKIVGQFTQAHPDVRLEVTCDLSRHLMANRQSSFDLILALQDDPAHATEEQIRIDELVWVTSFRHKPHLRPLIPMIAAPEGCLYRNRGTKALNRANQPWRVVYTIPDLTGIKAAIEEGLGITVLANSTVPDSLQIIAPSDRFPRLGKIGISLISNKKSDEPSVDHLAEYIKASLI